MFGLVHAKTVERSGSSVGDARKMTILFPLQGMKRPLRIFFRAFFQDNIDILGFWRPNPEMRLVLADQFGANGISARRRGLHELNPTQNAQTRSESLIKIS